MNGIETIDMVHLVSKQIAQQHETIERSVLIVIEWNYWNNRF